MKVYSNATIFKVYKKDSNSQKPQATVEEVAPSSSAFLATEQPALPFFNSDVLKSRHNTQLLSQTNPEAIARLKMQENMSALQQRAFTTQELGSNQVS